MGLLKAAEIELSGRFLKPNSAPADRAIGRFLNRVLVENLQVENLIRIHLHTYLLQVWNLQSSQLHLDLRTALRPLLRPVTRQLYPQLSIKIARNGLGNILGDCFHKLICHTYVQRLGCSRLERFSSKNFLWH
jgi:hypothetical protein